MTTRTNVLLVDLDDECLSGVVAGMLAPALGLDDRVERVRREPSPFASLFPAEVLSVSLREGQSLRLFLKHLGPEESYQPDKQRRDREPRVYEKLLGDPTLPVARCYGSRRNEDTGRLELYLEYLDDWHLKYHGLEHWFTAARELARLHAHFAARADLLRECDFLLKLDARYFADWAARALAAASFDSAPLAAAMKPALRAYGRVCEVLARQPVTLVHNDLAPKNVIADRTRSPARICFVDWEMAGAGCGLLDLVHLKYGLDAASDCQMVAEYRTELRGTGLLPTDDAEFERVLSACEAHKILYRVAHCGTLRPPPATLEQWVADARKHVDRV